MRFADAQARAVSWTYKLHEASRRPASFLRPILRRRLAAVAWPESRRHLDGNRTARVMAREGAAPGLENDGSRRGLLLIRHRRRPPLHARTAGQSGIRSRLRREHRQPNL